MRLAKWRRIWVERIELKPDRNARCSGFEPGLCWAINKERIAGTLQCQNFKMR